VAVQEHGDKAALDNPGGEELMARLGGKDAGLPFFAFLDAEGNPVVSSIRPNAAKASSANIGYPGQPEEIDWFLAMLAKAVPAMTPAESSAIEQWLRKHNH
jgi:hypothetical protein